MPGRPPGAEDRHLSPGKALQPSSPPAPPPPVTCHRGSEATGHRGATGSPPPTTSIEDWRHPSHTARTPWTPPTRAWEASSEWEGEERRHLGAEGRWGTRWGGRWGTRWEPGGCRGPGEGPGGCRYSPPAGHQTMQPSTTLVYRDLSYLYILQRQTVLD